jgi:uncharacterized membrane-anchored protein YitT (DUF2179 family)
MEGKAHHPIKLWTEVRQFIMIAIGAVIAAVGLELFLVPNNILDGGVIGLSIIAAKMTGLKLSLFIVLFNIPFLFIGYRKMGLRFVVHALFGVLVLSGVTAYLHHFEPFTDDLFLATIIGAVILGTGVGLVIRSGGVLDGTEVIAILVSQKKPVSVGQFIMVLNVFIFVLAAMLVFTWETAMYSIITYYLAYKMIDIVNEGLEELKSVTIISERPDEIARAIQEQLHRGMTFLHGEGAFSGIPKKIIYIIVSRIELSTLREIVNDIDPKALVAIENMADVSGSNFRKKSH